MTCDHERERLGTYQDVTGRRSYIVRAIEWCPICQAAYQRPVQFYDGVRWTEAERIDTHNVGMAERRRLLGLVNERRMAVATEIAREAAAKDGAA